MTPPPPETIHQAFFGWSLDSGKLDLIAYSFHQQPEGPIWRGKLEQHVRLQPSGTDMPASSLTYLDLADGNTAVLRRVASGHTSGRNNSHALIGPAATLDVRVALGLFNWPNWMSTAPNDRYLPPYAASYIAEFAGNAEQLRYLAEQNEHAIGRVLSRLLDNPARPLSILGCPQQERLPMVWGLHMAAASYLNDRDYPRTWSFSTHEVSHDDSIKGLPEVVFLPEKPLGAGVVNRTIVDLNAAPAASDNSELAGSLLATLFHGAPPMAKPVRETVYATSGAPAFGDTVATHPKQVRGEQRSGGQAVATQPPQPRRTDALLRAGSVHDFEAELHALEDWTRYAGNRHRLRGELDLAATDTISAFVERKARLEWFDRLLKITYGPNFEDLGQDGLEHATKLASQSQSDVLSMMLGRAVAGRRSGGPIRDTALDRAANGARPAAHAQSPRATSRLARRNQLLLSVAVTILLLGIVFLLGYLVGRPGAATQNSAPTTAAPPAASATPATISVMASPQQGQVVFGFVSQGGVLYPQAPCILKEGEIWECSPYHRSPVIPPDSGSTLQAFLVPKAEENLLNQQAKENKFRPDKGESWVGPLK
jgi:hypothetical protein